MANPSEFVATILDLLSDWGGVTARRMFSGYGLFRHGVIFGIVVQDTFYLRVDERHRAEFVERGMGPFTYARDRRKVAMSGYYEAPPDLFDDADEMVRWSARALDATLRRRQAKRPRQRGAGPA